VILQAANVSHNDLKPANFVVDWPQGESPTVSNLKIFLTDFGMADKLGGTPIYSSPEVLIEEKRKPGVSDLYSLGRVFAFLCSENIRIFIYLIFFSIEDQTEFTSVRNVIESIPILKLILQMTKINPNERIKIDQVQSELTSMNVEIISKIFLRRKGFPGSVMDLYEDQDYYQLHDQVTQMLKERLTLLT